MLKELGLKLCVISSVQGIILKQLSLRLHVFSSVQWLILKELGLKLYSVQFKNFNHPTRGSFAVVMAAHKKYIKLREQYIKQLYLFSSVQWDHS